MYTFLQDFLHYVDHSHVLQEICHNDCRTMGFIPETQISTHNKICVARPGPPTILVAIQLQVGVVRGETGRQVRCTCRVSATRVRSRLESYIYIADTTKLWCATVTKPIFSINFRYRSMVTPSCQLYTCSCARALR